MIALAEKGHKNIAPDVTVSNCAEIISFLLRQIWRFAATLSPCESHSTLSSRPGGEQNNQTVQTGESDY